MYTLKKSLGQHFLRDEHICRRIVAALGEHPVSRLLEVGPGGGALTKYLLQLPDMDLKVVEIDDEKADYLLRTYPALEGKLIRGDFLRLEKPFAAPFTVIGNFPYNISTEILFRIVDWKEEVECMIGMFQKEVAQRVASKEGNKVYGVTSVLIQAYFDVEYLFDVHEQCFTPPPKVRSGVIRLLPRKQRLALRSDADFFRLVKMAFNQRRKTLRNATRPLFTETTLNQPLFGKRAEQLSVEQFAELSFQLK